METLFLETELHSANKRVPHGWLFQSKYGARRWLHNNWGFVSFVLDAGNEDRQIPPSAGERAGDDPTFCGVGFHRATVSIGNYNVTYGLGGGNAKNSSSGDSRRFLDGDYFPKSPGIAMPIAGIGIGFRRVTIVILAPIQESPALIGEPRGELRAIPGPLPLMIVLRRDGPETVFFSEMLASKSEDIFSGTHGHLAGARSKNADRQSAPTLTCFCQTRYVTESARGPVPKPFGVAGSERGGNLPLI